MDLSYFTCDKTLTNDAAKMFNYLTSYSEPTMLNLGHLALPQVGSKVP